MQPCMGTEQLFLGATRHRQRGSRNWRRDFRNILIYRVAPFQLCSIRSIKISQTLMDNLLSTGQIGIPTVMICWVRCLMYMAPIMPRWRKWSMGT